MTLGNFMPKWGLIKASNIVLYNNVNLKKNYQNNENNDGIYTDILKLLFGARVPFPCRDISVKT